MDEIIKEETSFFNLKAIFKGLKRHLVKILAVVVTFAVLGGVYGLFFADLSYVSEASVIAFDDEVYADENEEIDVIQRTASSAKAMINEASGVKIFKNAIDKLKEKGIDDITVEGLRKEFTVTTNSMFILFKYQTSNKEAQLILDTVIEEFLNTLNAKDETTGKYVMTMFGGKLKVFTSATPVKEGDLTDNLISNAIIFAMIGGVLAVAVVILLALLRNTVLDKETVENELGIEVLAVVEELKEKKGGR